MFDHQCTECGKRQLIFPSQVTSLANTAEGITEEELPQLFDRFYRRDRSRNGRQAGSGLGLPIALDLAALLGGTLVASLGDGEITFRLELPAGSADSARAPVQTKPSG